MAAVAERCAPVRQYRWEPERRHIITGRDLAEYIHYDFFTRLSQRRAHPDRLRHQQYLQHELLLFRNQSLQAFKT